MTADEDEHEDKGCRCSFLLHSIKVPLLTVYLYCKQLLEVQVSRNVCKWKLCSRLMVSVKSPLTIGKRVLNFVVCLLGVKFVCPGSSRCRTVGRFLTAQSRLKCPHLLILLKVRVCVWSVNRVC